MKQITDFCENNQIYSEVTLSLKERLKLFLRGSLVIHIDQNNSSLTGRTVCYYQPKIKKAQ